MKTNKKAVNKLLLGLLAVATLAIIGSFFFFSSHSNDPIAAEFKKQATLYADSVVSGDYETVLKILDEAMVINFTPEDRKAILSNSRAVWMEDGFGTKSYKINGINKLSDNVYQLDGVFYGDGYEEIYAPLYYFYNNKWQMAVNEFQIPAQLVENIDYIKQENALDPNGLTILN